MRAWAGPPGPGRIDVGLDPPPQVTGMLTVDSVLAGNWRVLNNALSHLLLPALVLASYTTGLIMRVTRSSMLEVLNQDYMRTARAKGLSSRTMVTRHALRNALIPIITVIGFSYGNLLAGAVLTESIFAWPGIGQYAYRASTSLDFPAIMGVSMVIAVIFIITNLVVDVLYYVLDPRPAGELDFSLRHDRIDDREPIGFPSPTSGRSARARSRWRASCGATRSPRLGILILVMWVAVSILAPLHHALQSAEAGHCQPAAGAFGRALVWHRSVGRDVFTRVMYGGRLSLPAGIAVIVVAGFLGILVGAVAGFIGGWFDELGMRLTEVFMAFPTIILAMAIAAALGPSLANAVIAMVVVWWPNYARVVRSLVIGVKSQEYVEAARALGVPQGRVLWRTVLPNCLAPAVVLATVDLGNAILVFAGLSFLGLGAEPSVPEWGRMVADGIEYFDQWWIAAFAGLAIFVLVMGFNFIGDGIRDALDPRLRKSL